MSRIEVSSDDRLHWLIWRSWLGDEWCVAKARNGIPLDFANRFATWQEAITSVTA